MGPGDQVADGVEDGGGGDDDHPGDGVGADGERTRLCKPHRHGEPPGAVDTEAGPTGSVCGDEARVMAQAAHVARLALPSPWVC